MSAEISDAELLKLTQNVWSVVLGQEIVPSERDLMSDIAGDFVVGRVLIAGDWQGTVTLACSAEMARHAAASMFGKTPAETDDSEIYDALGELTNMVGGSYKTLLPGTCNLSVPKVDGTVAHTEMSSTTGVRHWLASQDGVVLVSVAREG
ncbi:MAG TPA: chemotaxis protein CheX [Polyangiaceae bacterium]|jgi:CheY-specific phosphatase CheX|nr:chemotaxis protein CheX [Polyangiaceae bacterium]